MLLNEFLTDIHKRFPSLYVLILAGNHDSASRLGFASSFLKECRICISSDLSDIESPVVIEDTCFYQVPFMNNIHLEGEDEFSVAPHSQAQIYEEVVRRILLFHKKNYPSNAAVLCAHATCFESKNKDYSVGTADLVNPDVFKGLDYVALGHIHKMMPIKESEPVVWYSGSPMAYSFDDSAPKGILSADIESKTHKVSVEKIILKQKHPIKRIRGTFKELNDESFAKDIKDCYIEAVCTDSTAVENPMMVLSKIYPHILSFRYEKEGSSAASSVFESRGKVIEGGKSELETMQNVFKLFMNDIYGPSLDKERFEKEAAIFKEMCEAVGEEE